MDGHRFDQLTKGLAAGIPRRRLIKGLAGGVIASMAAHLGRSGAEAQVTQAYCGNVTCADDPGVCNDGCVCCVFGNGNNRCMPPNYCGRLGGAIECPENQTLCNGECCDGDCVNGSCQVICSPNTDHCSFINTSCNGDSNCACYDTIDGAVACFSQTSCGGFESCDHDSDCPAGSACVFDYCCDSAGSCVSFCPSGSPSASFSALSSVAGQQHNQP